MTDDMTDYRRTELAELVRGLSRPLEPRPTATRPRRARLRGVKAVLFDIYGTLLISATGDLGVHSENLPEEALEQALVSSGFTPAPGRESLAAAARSGATRLVDAIEEAHARRRVEGVDYPEVEIREIWNVVLMSLREETLIAEGSWTSERLERLAIEYECRVNPVWPMPGTRPLLDTLKQRDFALGIVSNAQFYTPITLGALCGGSLEELGFRPELCSWSFSRRVAKPSVTIYEAVLEPLRRSTGMRPNETLYVGNDMLKDVWTAARAGCRTALFAGDARSLRLREDDARTMGLRPDIVVTELAQLPACLV